MESDLLKAESEIQKLEHEKVAREKAIEKVRIEYFVSRSVSVLENIGGIWYGIDLDVKKRFQKFLFPDGVLYDGEDFRTIKTALCIEKKWQENFQKSTVVTPVGVEPTIPRMKAECPRPLDDGAIATITGLKVYQTLGIICRGMKHTNIK